MSAGAHHPLTRRAAAALMRRLGCVTANEHQRLADEVGLVLNRLSAIEDGHARAIRELQEWNANQAEEIAGEARQIGEARMWLEELTSDLRHLRPRGTETDRALFLALRELSDAYRDVGDQPQADRAGDDLVRSELRAFSQNGEDGVIAEILRRIGAPDRSFVEFGVESGQEGNCVLLADVAGFGGLFIEADADHFSELQRKYEHHAGVTTRRQLVAPDNLERIFAEAGAPKEPAVLSIDIDGGDYWVWESLHGYRPRLVIVEYNSILPAASRLVQPRELDGWDGTDYFGASLGALKQLGAAKGYRLVYVELAALNAFFVREDLAGDRFAGEQPWPRGLPNYFALGYRHPPDQLDRRYLDLDSGELVTVKRH